MNKSEKLAMVKLKPYKAHIKLLVKGLNEKIAVLDKQRHELLKIRDKLLNTPSMD